MTASDIQVALRHRHAKDLYISECKNGPTQSIGARPIRLDGWAFLKTWSPVTSIGYEIKVSRSDFLNDHKWRDYLNLCHQFYFVAPKGLIQLQELPEAVGLIEGIGSKAVPRLVTRRKAQYRQPDSAAYESLLHYVLMCRVREGGTWVSSFDGVEEDPLSRRQREIGEWEAWLLMREQGKALGQRVSRRVADDLRQTAADADRAKSLVRGYESTREVLRSLGFDPDSPINDWRLSERIERALAVVDVDLIKSVERSRDQLTNTLARLQEVRERAIAATGT